MDIHLYPNPRDWGTNDDKANKKNPSCLSSSTVISQLVSSSSWTTLNAIYVPTYYLERYNRSLLTKNPHVDNDLLLRIGSYICVYSQQDDHHRYPLAIAQLRSTTSTTTYPLRQTPHHPYPHPMTTNDTTTSPSLINNENYNNQESIGYCSNLALWLTIQIRSMTTTTTSIGNISSSFYLPIRIEPLESYLAASSPTCSTTNSSGVIVPRNVPVTTLPFISTVYIQYYNDLSVFLPQPSYSSTNYPTSQSTSTITDTNNTATVKNNPFEITDIDQLFQEPNNILRFFGVSPLSSLPSSSSSAATLPNNPPSSSSSPSPLLSTEEDHQRVPFHHLLSVLLHGTILLSGQILSLPLFGPAAYGGVRYLRVWANTSDVSSSLNQTDNPPPSSFPSILRMHSTTVPVQIPSFSTVQPTSSSSTFSPALPSPTEWLQSSLTIAPGYANYLRRMISIVYTSLYHQSSGTSQSFSPLIHPSFVLKNHNILISGISGIGKNTLVRAFVHGLVTSNVSSSIPSSSPQNVLIPQSRPRLLRIKCTNVYQNTLGGTEALLSFFSKRIREQPYTTPFCTIILIEDIEILFTTKPVSSLAQRVKRILLTCIEQSNNHSTAASFPIIWIGLTSNPYSIDPRIIGPNRFSHLLPLSVPNPLVREQILLSLLRPLKQHQQQHPILDNDLDSLVHYIGNRTHGYTPADLSYVVTFALTKVINNEPPTKNNSRRNSYPLSVWYDYFNQALMQVRPSLLAQVSTNNSLSFVNSVLTDPENSFISLRDIIGLQSILPQLIFTLFGPLLYTKDYHSLNTNVPKGLLLYGDSGNGKTYLAHKLVNYAKKKGLANVITIQSTDIISALVGSSELMISTLFKQAHELSPCILLIDRFELLAPKRLMTTRTNTDDDPNNLPSSVASSGGGGGGNFSDRLLSVFLTELDGLYSSSSSSSSLATSVPELLEQTVFNDTNMVSLSSSKETNAPLVMVLGITENIHALDTAILRPGRLDTHIHIDYPTHEERKELLTGSFQKSPTQWSYEKSEQSIVYPLIDNPAWSVYVDKLSTSMEGWNRSAIIHLWEYAAMNAVRRQINDKTINASSISTVHVITVNDIDEAYRNYQ